MNALEGCPTMAECHFEKQTSYHGDNLDSLGGTNSGTVNLIAPQASIWLDEERKSLADGAIHRWRCPATMVVAEIVDDRH